MYYPLLRGRQFELIALRELATEGITQGYVTPIIEPVKRSSNNLRLANNIFVRTGQKAYLILNPTSGEIAGDNNTISDFLIELGDNNFLPAFYLNGNEDYISQTIEEYNLSNCMIIGSNEIQQTQELDDLIIRDEVVLFTTQDPERNRSLRRYLMDSDKSIIRLDDLFEREVRNSNYLSIPAHRFSEEHIYYQEDGYSGFSDYTPLSGDFIDGGSTPRAVVIHFTYLNTQNQIWIRHFTSNTNDSIANVQGKFGEAAHKCILFCQQNGFTNSAIEELREYYNRPHYPGLGTVKKISIKNHLTVVANYLR